MPRFARIAVNVPSMAGVFVEGRDAGTSFDYEVPTQLDGRLTPGHLVLVPFGNRTVQGVVLHLVDEASVAKTKSIARLVDPDPALTSAQILLAEWLSRRTLAPIGAVIGLFLPPGLDQQADTLYAMREGAVGLASREAGKIETRLVDLLRSRGSLRGRQIDRAIPRVNWRRSAQALVRAGLVSATPVLPPASVRPKFIRTAQLAAPPEVARSALEELGTTEATRQRRRKALEYLLLRPDAVNVSWVYAESGCNLGDLQELAERDLVILREQQVWRDPIAGSRRLADVPPQAASPLPSLTAEQQKAWGVLQAVMEELGSGARHEPVLLQGVTGSGKTELYIRLTLEAVRRGKQAIVLVPEIALTRQTVERFLRHFPGQVGLLHSRLSDGERYDTWRRARAGALKVLIGPRSALFAPFPRLGALIVDECHDASYHQAEPPFYDAVAAAQEYARIAGCPCVLGSATPSVVQRHAADIGSLHRIELKERVALSAGAPTATTLDLPPVRVIDMRQELKEGNRLSFARLLRDELGDVLRKGEQAILYLNRRGTATHVFCRSCGYVVRCPRCETPMTLHAAGAQRLLCHRCGYERQKPGKCPECGSAQIGAYGLGTEKVESELQRLFPTVRTLRWDWETTRQKDAHEMILHHFAAGRADVLIGTQMLAKGLDFPRVTLVGIVLADVGLFLPDPFAPERVFQLLTHVSGRAGRSDLGGKVVLQTFAPEHYAIQSASRHDVQGFHEYELAQRRRLGFPPFTRLLRLEYRHPDLLKAEDEARRVEAVLQRKLAKMGGAAPATIGPVPCFFSKLDGNYRWQIVLRGADPGAVLEGMRLSEWRVEVDPVSLL